MVFEISRLDDLQGVPCDDNVTQWGWGHHRNGLGINGQGLVTNNVFRDNIAVDNVGTGMDFWRGYEPGYQAWTNNIFEYNTLRDNGTDIVQWERDQPLAPNARDGSGGGVTIANNIIAGAKCAGCVGPGATLRQYVDRVPQTALLTTLPMRERILTEIGIDVDTIIATATARASGANMAWPIPQGGTQLGAP